MIRHLSQSHSVVVASLAESEQELRAGDPLKGFCTKVIADVLPLPARRFQAVAALAGPVPSSVAYFRSARLTDAIAKMAVTTTFDLVFVHCAFVAQYALPLNGAVRVLDFGDIDSGKWLDYARRRPFPLSVAYGREGARLRRYEARVAGQFDHCSVSTQGELTEYGELEVPVPCAVMPNGVDTSYFRSGAPAPDGSQTIVFLGRMDYFPNVDGILHFATQIWPRVRASVPGATLRVIGSNPTRSVRALAQMPGVSVTGAVPDVRPHLSDAAVAIAPLRVARGVQNKVLETMAMGIPTVVSREAAKGILAVDGEHFLVGDGPEAFADHVIQLLRNATLRRTLGEAGRHRIENVHAWSNTMSILDGVLEAARARAERRRSAPTTERSVESGRADRQSPRAG
jgi:sugar transferase (PEP-CTERM/EpsH1 system associated)